MAMTRLQLRTQATDLADVTGSSRWSTTAGTGEVDLRLGAVHGRLWRRLLNAHAGFRLAKRQPVADASGRFLWSDLSAADAKAYRVVLVALDNTPYQFTDLRDALLAEAVNASGGSAVGGPGRVWWREGDYLKVLPTPRAGATPTGIWVNHIPTPVHELASDATSVTWPDGYDDVLRIFGAAALLFKGAAETQASLELTAFGEAQFAEMMQDVCRPSTNPLQFRHADTAAEWGG
jgi:hypothetical protein